MNISREDVEPILNKYCDREFEKINNIDFPPLREHPITEKNMTDEFDRLVKRDDFKLSNVGGSKIISYFHPSIIKANRHSYLSPYDYWQKLKTDKNLFRRFYSNRLRCSDWFKEHDNMKYIQEGYVPDFIYGIGLSTSKTAPKVSVFSPKLAKTLIVRYLADCDTVFDPFSGFSGRMLGTMASGKKYIGQDLNAEHIDESNKIVSFLKDNGKAFKDPVLKVMDIFDDGRNEYDSLFTCSPYGNKEIWNGDGDKDLTCEQWIDICLEKYKCKKYLFVTDSSCGKYKEFAVDEIVNKSHFSVNKEYIILICR